MISVNCNRCHKKRGRIVYKGEDLCWDCFDQYHGPIPEGPTAEEMEELINRDWWGGV
jgi:hypothetical protein